MIVSIWRYSHFLLAVFSFITLTIAAATGIILAFEPVVERASGYKVDKIDTLSLAQVIPVLKEKLPGVSEVSINDFQFVEAKFSGENEESIHAYINPISGKQLGPVKKQSAFFEWVTGLHRSLFLHETGRLLIGITSFLLILITISGIALIIKRQNGIRNFFSPVEKTGFAQYYHTVFGRIFLILIIAIALTGTYLSSSRFIIKPKNPKAVVAEENIKEEPELALKDFKIFKQTRLSDVKSIQFPFSDFPEDYYTIRLKSGEIAVNQFTGDVLARDHASKALQLHDFSFEWHTGRSNIFWAILMAITSAYILFFIYSGLWIAWKRIRSRSKNKCTPEESEVIILVGSENGSTYKFAGTVHKQLLKQGVKTYLSDMDKYKLYPSAKYLLIFSGTYGDGDAPSNATKFIQRLNGLPQQNQIQFSVLAFGSRSYEHFCRFGIEVQQALEQQSWAIKTMNMHSVDEKSVQDFSNWLDQWVAFTGYKLNVSRSLLKLSEKNLYGITVINKTQLIDDAFIIQLKTKLFRRFRSGDLLAVYPKNDHRERLYSIGKVNGNMQLSVKYFENGLGSSFLNGLQNGQQLKVAIIKNEHFHFPKKAKQVLMICNGTGIAPFLGMIDENSKQIPVQLYAGFKTAASFELYASYLTQQQETNKLSTTTLALSREGARQYVCDLVKQDAILIANFLADGGHIMICGSLSMEKDVMKELAAICENDNRLLTVEEYRKKDFIRTDCY